MHPPSKACLWIAIGRFYRKKWGCSSDSLRYHRKHSATWVLLHLSRNRGGVFRSGHYGSTLSTLFARPFFLLFFPSPPSPSFPNPSPFWDLETPLFPRGNAIFRGWGAARVEEGVTTQKKEGISLKKRRAKIGQSVEDSAVLFHVCGSPDPFFLKFMQQDEPFLA